MGTTKTSTAVAVAALFISCPAGSSFAAAGATGSLGTVIENVRFGIRRDERELTDQAGTAQFVGLEAPVGSLVSTVPSAGVVVELRSRATTPAEEVIGEIRDWARLEVDWDGEGARAPVASSLKDASSFVCSIDNRFSVPSAMLHPSGHAGLFWRTGDLYADLEFLGDGRVSYFIERSGDGKHKGVVTLRKEDVPPVFAVLLGA